MDVNDESLAVAAAAGDADAFALLLERVYDRVFALSFRVTGIAADAEDLTQDICLVLPQKIAGFRGQSRFTTWLYRVVMNAAIDKRRRAASYRKAMDGWSDWNADLQAQVAEAQDQADWLATAMRSLSPALRDTLALVLDDVSHAEAGEILGVSEGTISWRVAEAKKRLKALREEETST